MYIIIKAVSEIGIIIILILQMRKLKLKESF